jgi:hypothetical protein
LGCVLLGILAVEADCRGLREATEWPAASSSSADTSMGHACRWVAPGAAVHAPALSSRANRVASNDPASWPACTTCSSWCHSSHAGKQQAPLPQQDRLSLCRCAPGKLSRADPHYSSQQCHLISDRSAAPHGQMLQQQRAVCSEEAWQGPHHRLLLRPGSQRAACWRRCQTHQRCAPRPWTAPPDSPLSAKERRLRAPAPA